MGQLELLKYIVAAEHDEQMRRNSRSATPGPAGCVVKNGFSAKLARVLEVVALSLQNCGFPTHGSAAEKFGLKKLVKSRI